ncbi:hypothetical protein EHS25_007406 [Saitozyma podzolica]|uniref:Luciferase domain-containing protein n=1 Tax=Saitozyma podzolica TaxID=1890683 RepID=A0A427YPN4_9TREE|nr:hypothetical protein EHS25_007406 [Saitozyma podzolica]
MSAIALVLLGVIGTVWVSKDYDDWKAFGTGGTPPNKKGYIKMRKVWLKRLLQHDDLRDASTLPTDGPRYLNGPLPHRRGGRPQMMERVLPHRQKPEGIDPEARERLHSLVAKLLLDHPKILKLGPSKTEGGAGDAIYAKDDVPTLNHAGAAMGYEIAHVHLADNSLHMYLSPLDARAVIESEWGERFPVKELGPPGWVMVYAPRDNAEVDVVESIMKAAVEWVTGAILL